MRPAAVDILVASPIIKWMRTFLALPLLFLALGCGDDGADGAATGGSSTGGSGTGGNSSSGGGGAGGTTGAGGGCTLQPNVTPGDDWVCVTELNGRIIDESGAPLSGVTMSVCGPNGCTPDDTGADGSFSIQVGFPLLADDYSLVPHAREMGKLVLYMPLDADEPGPVVDMGERRLLDTPAGGDVLIAKTDEVGAPAQTVSHGDVTMDVPSGVRVNLAFEDVAAGADGKLFRARKVPDALQDEYVDPAMNVVALYAMTPFDARFDFEGDPGTPAKVALAFANTAGLAADAPVQFLQHGSFVVGDLEAGDYVVVGTGSVSSDGATIQMDAGEGITFLTWVAVRPAP